MRDKTLYDQDFATWVQVTVEQLKQRDWDHVDLVNLVNEVEGLTKQEQRELRKNLKLLLWQILKWQYQPQKRSRSWEVTIEQTQEQIADILEQSPSLARSLQNSFELVYKQARSKAKKETGLPLTVFPDIKEELSWKIYEKLEELKEEVRKILTKITPETITSLTNWNYLQKALTVV